MSENASDTHASQRRLLESDQTRDGLWQAELGAGISVRLLHQRCREARSQHLPGQDYARALAAPDGSSLAFCVCDGVGSSYMGDFAARYLAVRLVEWLDVLNGVPDDMETFAPRLSRRLAQWATEAQAELNARTIPADTADMVREVLEDLRRQYGSETVFFAGRIDRAAGTPGVRALLCWMGNISAYLFTSAMEGAYLRPADDAVRWSTARGVRGDPEVRLFTLSHLERLLVHTDGCDTLSEEIAFLSNGELRERCETILALPVNDDMTMLDIHWAADAGQGKLKRDTPLG